MPRPRHEHPTPAELEVLKVLWERGPSTGREVMEALDAVGPKRAYTSVMSLLNVMAEKELVDWWSEGRAFVYEAAVAREIALGGMVTDLWRRAFEGSTASLVARLLEQVEPSQAELEEIRRAIEAYVDQQGDA